MDGVARLLGDLLNRVVARSECSAAQFVPFPLI